MTRKRKKSETTRTPDGTTSTSTSKTSPGTRSSSSWTHPSGKPLFGPSSSGGDSFGGPSSAGSTAWFDQCAGLRGRDATSASDPDAPPASPALRSAWRTYASSLLATEKALYTSRLRNSPDGGDASFVMQAARSGSSATSSDRIAALGVLVQSSPLHNLDALGRLTAMLAGDKRAGSAALDALRDLWSGEAMLPESRALVPWEDRPWGRYAHPPDAGGKSGPKQDTLSPKIVLLWFLEDSLLSSYGSFISSVVEHYLYDASNAGRRISAVRTLIHLLASRPTLEGRILSAVMDKLGDPDRSVVKATGHSLRRLINVDHPAMVGVVTGEAMELARKRGAGDRAKYNAVAFLTQVRISKDEAGREMARRMVETYFRLFEDAVARNTDKNDVDKRSKKLKKKEKQKGATTEVRSRLLCALLTGVNRAHPYLSQDSKDWEQILPKHVDALYRLSHATSSPATAVQALTLLFSLMAGSGSSSRSNNNGASVPDPQGPTASRFYRALYAALAEPTSFRGKHRILLLNLTFRAIRADGRKSWKSSKDAADKHPFRPLVRPLALLHRLLYAAAFYEGPGMAASAIYLTAEVTRAREELRVAVDVGGKGHGGKFVCIDTAAREPRDGALKILAAEDDVDEPKEENASAPPKLAICPLWEMALLRHHYHPSVAAFTASFLDAGVSSSSSSRSHDAGGINYLGDPLRDFSLIHFLDRFAFRNPKGDKDKDAMGTNVWKRRGTVPQSMATAVNDPNYWNEDRAVAVEEEFFAKYFREKANRDGTVKQNNTAKKTQDEDALLDLDQGGSSDEEEVAFAHSMAEKIMESRGNGPAHYDDEDPENLDDWGDLMSDEEDEKTDNDEDDEDAFNFGDHDDDSEEDEVEEDLDDSQFQKIHLLDDYDEEDFGRETDKSSVEAGDKTKEPKKKKFSNAPVDADDDLMALIDKDFEAALKQNEAMAPDRKPNNKGEMGDKIELEKKITNSKISKIERDGIGGSNNRGGSKKKKRRKS